MLVAVLLLRTGVPMTDSETSDSLELASYTPVSAFKPFLGAVLESLRDVPGDQLVFVRIGLFTGYIPAHQFYGLMERIAMTDVG